MIRRAIRSPLRPGITSPTQFRPRVSGNSYAAFNAFVQSLYTGGETGIWYDGTDPTQRAVNSDGSGGQPALGAKFGWLNDKTGGGRPAIQATSVSQPIAGATGVVFAYEMSETVTDELSSKEYWYRVRVVSPGGDTTTLDRKRVIAQ